ncbi:MAG: class I SAM-dependent methyltransferase [Candidatus Gastranaerophilales bacterium]|nr:class I SAM-dependent methyltransferase [Candidatus Gastranaerophilales bacterium]
MNSVKRSEREYHNKRFTEDPRKKISIFYFLFNSINKYYSDYIEKNANNKNILEIGCGTESLAVKLVQYGANVNAIDISDVAIKLAKENSQKLNLNINYSVMDAEILEFEQDSFDLICGNSILHHLNIDNSLKEIVKVLKKDGKAVFREPLGHNFIVNLFRKSTPILRSPDEHPLLKDDLAKFNGYFKQVDLKFYYFTALLALILNKTIFAKLSLQILEYVDNIIFLLLPFARKYAWQVCIILSQPKK